MKQKKILLAMILFLLLGVSIQVLTGSRAEPVDIQNYQESTTNETISKQNHFDNDIMNESKTEESETQTLQESVSEKHFPMTIPTESQNNSQESSQSQDTSQENSSLESEIEKIIGRLEEMLEEASKESNIEKGKSIIEQARTFYKENQSILMQTSQLSESVREIVEKKLEQQILPILKDTQSPVITGVLANAIVNHTNDICITEENQVKIYLNQELTTLAQLRNITEDGIYEILVVDEAFNTAMVSFTLDSTLPEIANIRVEKKDSSSHFAKDHDVMIVRMDVSEELQGNPYVSVGGKIYETTRIMDTNQYEVEILLEEALSLQSNEKIAITISNVIDLAGNKQEVITTTGENDTYVIYDDTMVTVTNFEIFSSNENPYFAKLNDEITLSLVVSEPLQKMPTIQIYGKEYQVEEKKLEEDAYSYQVHFVVDEFLKEGPMLFSVRDVIDRAGNILEQTLSNETISKNVVVDNTPVKENWLYVLNPDSTNHKRVRDGEKLYIELVFEEAPTTTPILQVASFSPQEMKCVWRDESDGWASRKYKCDATVKIEENSGLTSGEVVPIKITNIYDAAGNETVLTTESITEEKNKGYGQVIYDTEAPRFDLSKIPTTFVVGKDIYIYPQPGIVMDDVDTISFGNVHMQWFKQNVDGTKGEETKCFGWENWNTSLTNCELGTYIVTYRVSDSAKNETYEERTITLTTENQRKDYLDFSHQNRSNFS